jgi:hypothetical protein
MLSEGVIRRFHFKGMHDTWVVVEGVTVHVAQAEKYLRWREYLQVPLKDLIIFLAFKRRRDVFASTAIISFVSEWSGPGTRRVPLKDLQSVLNWNGEEVTDDGLVA